MTNITVRTVENGFLIGATIHNKYIEYVALNDTELSVIMKNIVTQSK